MEKVDLEQCQRLRQLRLDLGLTLKDVEKLSGKYRYTSFSMFELGKSRSVGLYVEYNNILEGYKWQKVREKGELVSKGI